MGKINEDKEALLTQANLRELLSCDKETGGWTWIKKPSKYANIRIGQPAGSLNKDGYIYIKINGYNYPSHRLVWLYFYGYSPTKPRPLIDHINQVKTDNRLCNLREASYAENALNKGGHSDSLSGIKGVYRRRNGRYAAQIKDTSIGKMKHLGTYDTIQEAKSVHDAKAKELHGVFVSLQICTPTENIQNAVKYTRNRLISKGVEKLPSGRFRARFLNPLTKKLENLGTYLTEHEAASAYETRTKE